MVPWIVLDDIDVSPGAPALDGVEVILWHIRERFVVDALVDRGGKRRIKMLPKASLAQVLTETTAYRIFRGAYTPEMLTVEHEVWDVVEVRHGVRRAPPPPGLLPRLPPSCASNQGERLQNVPTATLILVHDPGVIGPLTFGWGAMVDQRPEGDAYACAADATPLE